MIKKLLLKVGLMLGGLFAVMLFLPGPNGKPMMAISDLPGYGLWAAGSKAVESAGEVVSDSLQEPAEIYTWVDENGAVHYSDTPVQGSQAHQLSEGNDAIPADNFTGQAYRARSAEPRSGSRFLIKQRDAKAGQPAEVQLDKLANGDIGDAAAALKDLPGFLQQAQQAQQARAEALP